MRRLLILLALVALSSARASAQPLEIIDTIPGAFIDISQSGTALGLADDGVVEIDAGFDLTATLFAGDGSGRVWVSNNGAIGFLGDGGASGAFSLNSGLPSFALFGGAHGTPQALAVYWDDLDSDTGDVYYTTIGEPGRRIFIIQWQDRPHFSGDEVLDGDEATLEVLIYETPQPCHARMIYADVEFLDPALDNGASATIGYQAGGIGNDVQWSFNEAGAVQAGTSLCLTDQDVCVGDTNGDGVVDVVDMLALLADWGPCSGCPTDFNGDLEVTVVDLLILLAAWGPC